jgi:hypothetical protein
VEDRLTSGEIRRADERLPVEPPRPKQRRIEVLQPVRCPEHDDAVARPESVELDEQLVQRLILLAVEAVAGAGGADGVELVDEDDRGRVLTRLLEELPDPRRTQPREHLDECRGALGVELRAGLVGGGLREQRLPRPRRAVEEHALRHVRAEALESLRIAEELDDLEQLGLRLVGARDVAPGDRARGVVDGGCGLHPRHHL